jgi:hypothetical protein
MLATWRSFTWASGFVTGKALLRGLPREAKPFTRLKFMAKWEIRFQRFAISFRPSALDVCRARHVAAWQSFTRFYAVQANEKFHLSPISQHGNMAEIIGKFGGAARRVYCCERCELNG